MSDLSFEIRAEWSGLGKQGEGRLFVGEETFQYSAPTNMGGKGVGVSPEDLLISAVTSCYSGTLFGALKKSGLPVSRVSVRTEGFVTGFPLNSKFSRLVVHPTVFGGDEARKPDYNKTALTARDRCFIGKTIFGNVDYEVGEVQVAGSIMEQKQVDELVERFYVRLTNDPYYTKMFSERNVDLALLKERQRVFIARLANAQTQTDDSEVQQVQERHSFGIDPQRTEAWMNHMKAAMEEMGLEQSITNPLLEKMQFLADKMLEKAPK